MKKQTFICLLLLIAGWFSGIAQPIYISGNISHASNDSVTITHSELFSGMKNETYQFPVLKGHFSGTIKNAKNPLFIFSYRNANIDFYAEGNDSILIQFHADSLPNAKFTGKVAENNTFLLAFNKAFSSYFKKETMEEKMKTSSIDVFENAIFSNRKKQNDFIKSYASKTHFSANFASYMDQMVRFQYFYLLMAYPIINANSNTGMSVNELPPLMLEPLEKMEVNIPSAMICESYRNFIYYYIVYFTSKSNGYKKFTDYSMSMDKKFYCAQQRLQGLPYHWFLAKYLFDDDMKSAPSIVKKVYNALEADEKKGPYAKLIKEKSGSYMNSKDPEKGSSTQEVQFKLKDLDGKNISLSDYKGKVIYVDFWASWCGPCRQQFPFSHLLKDKFNDKQKKQIVFLYISIDEDEAAWRSAIVQNKLEGTLGISPGNWNSEVVKFFRINSIPRYMLIDKLGNIADPNAKRPSEPGVVDDILRLLEP